jgi:hypothetical protein
MSTDDRNLFRTLAPPPGGVERFRRRLGDVDAETRPMPGRRFLAAGLAAVLIAVITVNWPPGGGDLPSGSQTAPPMSGSAGSTATTVGGSEGTPAVSARREAAAFPEATTVPGAKISEATMPAEATETRELTDLRRAPAFARLLGQPLRPAKTRIAIDDMQVAVVELPSTNSKVRIYQVSNN